MRRPFRSRFGRAALVVLAALVAGLSVRGSVERVLSGSPSRSDSLLAAGAANGSQVAKPTTERTQPGSLTADLPRSAPFGSRVRRDALCGSSAGGPASPWRSGAHPRGPPLACVVT